MHDGSHEAGGDLVVVIFSMVDVGGGGGGAVLVTSLQHLMSPSNGLQSRGH